MMEKTEGPVVVDDSRQIPQVPVDLSWADRLGAWNARWGIGFGLERKGLSLDYTFSRGMLHDPYYVSLSYQY